MARQATKAQGNMFFEARNNAAKYDERMKSRAMASELLGISESQLSRYELGITKDVPVDVVALMSDRYNAPELKNRYCKEICPIGCGSPISCTLSPIEKITIQLLRDLDKDNLDTVMKKLINVAADGEVSEDEKVTVNEIVDYFDRVLLAITELRIMAKKNGQS